MTFSRVLHMSKSPWLLVLFSLCLVALAPAQSCDDTLFPVIRDRKLGFIDKSGHEIIPPRFADYRNLQYFPDLPQFNEGLAPVSEKDRFGYIDCSGNFIIAPQFASARPFSEGIAAVREGTYPQAAGKALWIDHTGRVLHAEQARHFQTDFHDGFLLMADEKNGWEPGYTNKDFQWSIASQALFRSSFHEGFAVFGVGDPASRKFGFIDKSGQIVIPAHYDRASDFSEGLAGVCYWKAAIPTSENEKTWRCGFLDPTGQVVIPLNFKSVSPFSEGRALAEQQDGQRAILDKTGHVISVVSSLEVAGQFHEGLALAKKGDRIGFIDAQGAWAIPARFAGASDFSHGVAMVQLSDKEYGYIDRRGKLIWQAKTTVPPIVFIPSTFAAGSR
ncbi:MAG TPA: WG repeat-containing protein [Candidatus Angelobacter sp.]|nr:WG repeat-containing protein [Candidatus Angelobacter sp.]